MADEALRIDPDLIQRYDIRAPRYTSYPTAASFSGAITRDDYIDAISRSNDLPIPNSLSLYVHLPFCEQLCYYCGCNKVVTRNREKADLYLKHLYREADLLADLLDRDRYVRDVHLGGGTPTFLTIEQLTDLVSVLNLRFTIDSTQNRRWSIEVDPRTVTAESIEALARLGFNRLSMGIQDLDQQVQQAINRVQPAAHIREILLSAREFGFNSINMDLMYGLPKQNMQSFHATLDEVIAFAPDRIALYGYAHLPHLFKSQRLMEKSDLPSAKTRLDLFLLAVEKLTGAGYEYIGMDHFALPHDELTAARTNGDLVRNFQGYDIGPRRDLVGLGVSAISMLDDIYVQNAKRLPDYYSALDQDALPTERGYRLTKDDQLRRAVIQAIMCKDEVSFEEIADQFGINFPKYFAHEIMQLQNLVSDGLIRLKPHRLHITMKGRLLLRLIAMLFDKHIQSLSKPAPVGPHNQFAKLL